MGFPSVHLYFIFQVRKTPQWWLLWSVLGDSEQCKCNNLRQWSQSLQCSGHSGRSLWCAQVLCGSAARSPESSRAFHPVEQHPRGLEHKPHAALNSSHSSDMAEYPFQSAKHMLLQDYLVGTAHGTLTLSSQFRLHFFSKQGLEFHYAVWLSLPALSLQVST